MKDKKIEHNKIIKTIKIFEPGGNYNQDNEEILDNICEGVILLDENKKFEGALYKGDNVLYISGYLGNDVVSIDMLGKSINAIKQKDDSYLGVVDVDDQDLEEEVEMPCMVILSNLKEDNTIDKNKINDIIYTLKSDKVMVLERNLQK